MQVISNDRMWMQLNKASLHVNPSKQGLIACEYKWTGTGRDRKWIQVNKARTESEQGHVAYDWLNNSSSDIHLGLADK